MKAYVDSAGGTPTQIASHPLKFESGDWTCVIGDWAFSQEAGRFVLVPAFTMPCAMHRSILG